MTNIEWTDQTWNPVTGCTRVSAGCDNCYAVQMTKRLEAMGNKKYTGLVNLGKSHFNGVVKTHDDALLLPLTWRKPRRVFVNSMSDLFHPDVPFEFIDKAFAVMALCPQHTFQILTKRPERMAEYTNTPDLFPRLVDTYTALLANGSVTARQLNAASSHPSHSHTFVPLPLPNAWLGTSCENQETADERIPHLLRCPAAVRFLSCEPLLGGIDLKKEWLGWCPTCEDFNRMAMHRSTNPCVDWAIVGGESGKNRRPMEMSWLTSIADQCKAAGVPVFVKQDSARLPGQQGRIAEQHWSLKQFPAAGRA